MLWLFGSPSPRAQRTWFVNRGSGYVLFREAMRRLVNGAYIDGAGAGAGAGPKLAERWEGETMGNCCGDSALGLAAHENANITLGELFPLFQPHPLHVVALSNIH